MANFDRQLRELSKDAFESLVHQYLISTFPGAGIKQVDGSGGDGGIDSFSGSLGSGPAVWQCKHFPDRIRKKQKEQIVDSIKRAFEEAQPSFWTLCVPINLRTAEHKWFQEEVVKCWGGSNRIKLLQASDLSGEILRNRPLRDAFFPENAISELRGLRRDVLLGDQRTPPQTEDVLIEIAQEYLSGKMDTEPRLEPIIEIGGSPNRRINNDRPGLVASISDEQKTLHLFAKNPDLYNLDPITITTNIGAENAQALNEAFDLGKPLLLEPGRIFEIASNSPLFNALLRNTDISKISMEIQPRLPEGIAARILPLRFIAGAGASARELFYIPFRPVRMGLREAELVSNTMLPISIALTLRMPPERSASITFKPTLIGADIQQLDQVLQFLQEAGRSNSVEVVSVETNERLFNQISNGFESNLKVPEWIHTLVADAAVVAKELGVPLKLPAAVTAADARDLVPLVRIAKGTDFYNVDLCGALTMTSDRREFVRAQLAQREFPVMVDFPAGGRLLNALGTPIDPGHVAFFAQKAKFADIDRLQAALEKAVEGETIPICLHCEGPCHWERIPNKIC